LETRLSLLLSAGRLSPQRFVEVTTTNPAKLYGMYPPKGSNVAGVNAADIVIRYPDGALNMTIKNANLRHDVDHTPFEEGRRLGQWSEVHDSSRHTG